MIALEIQQELESLGNALDAAFARRFFKTGPGEYGEGDLFRGLRLPVIRKLAKKIQGHTRMRHRRASLLPVS